MPFKYIDGKIVEVEHKTVFGKLQLDIGAISLCPHDPDDPNEFSRIIRNCLTPSGFGPKGQPIYELDAMLRICLPPF